MLETLRKCCISSVCNLFEFTRILLNAMASHPQPSQQVAYGATENGVDRTEDGRPIFKSEHYDKIEMRGAIRILNVFPGHPEDLEVHCELIPGTILDYKERMECKPPLKFEPYDALSWCWGTLSEESWISIRKGGTRYAKSVRSDLVAALRTLRHHEHDRPLWIDAVCIDQSNFEERNHQVEMMADIYGKADCVRIWLGNPTDSSNLAIRFIKKEVLQLQHFDELCESKEASAKWKSLLELMQRPWFSRRWVVQEVALARKAIIHCGSAKISWNKFAVAVELFVEVETATHRLSEVMKKDPKYYHVPLWFEYVSALGASLLVDATGKLFRDYEYSRRLSEKNPAPRPTPKTKSPPDPDDDANFESEDEELLSPRERAKQHERDDLVNRLAPKGQPLLNLEYLVCSLSIFDTSKPHDTIYALLGIAKDTTPTAANKQLHVTDHTQAALEMFTEKKQYTVDYQASYVDICKEFIQFCVNRSLHVDPSRALDVICRPWATEENPSLKNVDEMPLPSWVPQLSKASYGMDTKPGVDGMKMGRKNADALVGLPSLTQRNYNAAETKGLDTKTFRFRKRVAKKEPDLENAEGVRRQGDSSQQKEPSRAGDNAKPEEENKPNGTGPEQDEHTPVSPKREGHSESKEEDSNEQSDTANGRDASKTSTRVKNEPKLELNYFSMYAKGFILDKIHKVQPSSQNGSIPSEWADFAHWKNMQGNPPDHFWRTLVADRGKDGKNPPVYYSRACKESFNKGSFQSGTIDTTGLINNERNSVVAQFCRRVQAAIWNRALVRTESGKLGLVAKNVQAGDLVCILYGCSVPVILRRHGPKDPRVMDFEMEWELKHLADRVGGDYRKHLARKEIFRAKREKDNEIYMKWEQTKRAEWAADKQWADKWKKARQELMLIHEFSSWAMNEKTKGTKSDEEIEKMQDYINVSVTDKSRPVALTKEQTRFWDEFVRDKTWRDQWRQENYRYSAEDGFRVWLQEKRKLAGYPEEWKVSRDEWRCKDDQWRSRWKAENSRFLCIDSFRAWLREKGKFSGTEEDVKDKQDWELDTEWRQEWRSANPNGSEQDEFSAWMDKSGRKNTTPQEVKTKEEWSQYNDWRKSWRLEHKDASLDDEFEAWKTERDKRAALERDIDRLRLEAAKKQQSEPFLERWRKDWRPPAVNWRDFKLALTYGRRWKQLIIREKKDFLKRQKDTWSSLEERRCRQKDRASVWEQMKRKEGEAVREQESRVTELWPTSAPKHKGERQDGQKDVTQRRTSRADSIQRDGRIAVGETGVNGTSTIAMVNGKTQAAAERGTDQMNEGFPSENRHGIEGVNPEPNFADIEHNQGASGPNSSSMTTYQTHDREGALGSGNQDMDLDSFRFEEQPRANKLSRSRTSLPVREIQSELTHNILSKADLKERIKKKKEELPEQWRKSQAEVEKCLEKWKYETPLLVGRDGKKYYDCGRKKDGKRKQRERLSEEEKRTYQERIVANFRASLGDDGRWWYQMFGECYIHGMMDGEAMAHQNNEGIPTTVFEIR